MNKISNHKNQLINWIIEQSTNQPTHDGTVLKFVPPKSSLHSSLLVVCAADGDGGGGGGWCFSSWTRKAVTLPFICSGSSVAAWRLSQLIGALSPVNHKELYRETFIKRYVVERTSKAEIKPEEQSEKAEFSGEFMEWNTVERATKTETDTRTD